MRFAALESGAGRDIRARHPGIANEDSMIWVERPGRPQERVYTRSAAVLRIASYMGGPWRIARVGTIVPRRWRDAAYDLVARHRHRLGADPDRCYVPSPETRERFIDG